jgi:hypothetical protein
MTRLAKRLITSPVPFPGYSTAAVLHKVLQRHTIDVSPDVNLQYSDRPDPLVDDVLRLVREPVAVVCRAIIQPVRPW